jgi:hypothetical protein
MAKKSSTAPLNNAEARARLSEARAYLETAELHVASNSQAERKVSGSNAILAGIAAADAICGLILGERSSGEDHTQAVTLLTQAVRPAKKAPNSLRRLLSEKTPVQYGVQPVSLADVAQLLKWARDVVDEANERAR